MVAPGALPGPSTRSRRERNPFACCSPSQPLDQPACAGWESHASGTGEGDDRVLPTVSRPAEALACQVQGGGDIQGRSKCWRIGSGCTSGLLAGLFGAWAGVVDPVRSRHGGAGVHRILARLLRSSHADRLVGPACPPLGHWRRPQVVPDTWPGTGRVTLSQRSRILPQPTAFHMGRCPMGMGRWEL